MVQNPANPFHYGYYEIEARVLRNQPKEHLGLWPAFWFQHSEKNDPIPGKYWYEEVDIFEPNACQVAENKNVVHYWTLLSDNDSMHTSNTWRDPEHVHEITLNSLGNWHKYGVEWLPNRLIFYVDGEPFHTIQKRVPFHDRPQLFIDLQLVPQDWGCSNLKTTAGDYIGTFQINYFKYYKLPSCSGPITEAIGNGYNFNTWINALNTVYEYCIFKNTSIPSSSNIIVRAGDYVELKEDFIVPLGASLEIRPTQCQ